MDIAEMVAHLRAELDDIDHAILALECLTGLRHQKEERPRQDRQAETGAAREVSRPRPETLLSSAADYKSLAHAQARAGRAPFPAGLERAGGIPLGNDAGTEFRSGGDATSRIGEERLG